MCTVASADTISRERAINAIIGEAEDQGQMGMNLIACAIRNRGTLEGVYGEKSKRVTKKMYPEEIYDMAAAAWDLSAPSDKYGFIPCAMLHGATHWENIKAFGRPYWIKDMIVTHRYGDHVFYRKKRHAESKARLRK